MKPTPAWPIESAQKGFSETPGKVLQTSANGLVMHFAASVFNREMVFFGGINDPSDARTGSIELFTFDISIDDPVVDIGDTPSISIFLDESADPTPPGQAPFNANLRYWHISKKTPTTWVTKQKCVEGTFQNQGGNQATFGHRSIPIFDSLVKPAYSGFAVYPWQTYAVSDLGIVHEDPIGACFYLYAAGTKGLVTKHRKSLTEPDTKLRAAKLSDCEEVTIPENSLTGPFSVDQTQVILFWIGKELSDINGIFTENTLPKPPDFDPADIGFYKVQ